MADQRQPASVEELVGQALPDTGPVDTERGRRRVAVPQAAHLLERHGPVGADSVRWYAEGLGDRCDVAPSGRGEAGTRSAHADVPGRAVGGEVGEEGRGSSDRRLRKTETVSDRGGLDAVPQLVAALPELSEGEQRYVLGRLCPSRLEQADDWNLSSRQAADALSAVCP